METPPDLRYHPEDVWARVEDGRVRIGITDYAQDQLGDVVYVDLPAVGARIERDAAFGEIESTKTVSDLHAPVTGTVAERNDIVVDRPALTNTAPYGAGWLLIIEPDKLSELDDLLDAQAYHDHRSAD